MAIGTGTKQHTDVVTHANPSVNMDLGEGRKLKAENDHLKEEIARLTNENKALHAKWDAIVKAMAAADPELGDNKRLKDEVAHLRKRAGI